jgi:hypothetical protein
MKIKYTKLFAVMMAGMFVAVLAVSANAQWTPVGNPTYDADNNLVGMTEKDRSGNTRITRRQFYNGTHVMMREQIRTVNKVGVVLTEILERRDTLNRVTFQSNTFLDNKKVKQGYRQTIRYRDNRDTRGINFGEKLDGTGRWIRA